MMNRPDRLSLFFITGTSSGSEKKSQTSKIKCENMISSVRRADRCSRRVRHKNPCGQFDARKIGATSELWVAHLRFWTSPMVSGRKNTM